MDDYRPYSRPSLPSTLPTTRPQASLPKHRFGRSWVVASPSERDRCLRGDQSVHHKVLVDDNFHYMDEDERTEPETYLTTQDAIEAPNRSFSLPYDGMTNPT